MTYSIDTGKLSTNQAQQVQSLVENLTSDPVTQQDGCGSPHPDAFQYDVVAEDGNASKSWTFHGDAKTATALFDVARSVNAEY